MTFRCVHKISVLLVALWLAGCDLGQSYSDVEYVYRARERLEQGEHRSAVIELKNALVKNPDNADARLMLGELLLDNGDGASAEKELRRAQESGVPLEAVQVQLARALYLQHKYEEVIAIQAAPGLSNLQRAELLAVRGHALMRRGMINEAEEIYNQARGLAPTSAAPLVGQSMVSAARHEFTRAEQLLDEALSLEENDIAAWSLRGDLAQYQGRLEEAVEAYDRALGVRRDQLGNLEKRAVLLSYLRRFDEARNDIANMRALNPLHPAVDYASGVLSLQEQQYENARGHFGKLLGKLDDYRDAILQLGVANLAAGDVEQAELYLSRAFARNPNHKPGRILLAVMRLQKGEFSSSVQLLEPVVTHDPANHQARVLMISALMQSGRTDEALEHLRKLVKLNPESAEAQAQLGFGMLIKGQYDEGIQLLEAVRAQSPELVQTEIVLVMAHLHRGAYPQAVAAAHEFAARHPRAAMPLILLGMGQLGLGERAEARTSFEAALLLNPGDPAATRNLANLDIEDGNFDAARERYEQTLEVYPDHAPTLHSLVMLESRVGNEKGLEKSLNKAISAHPDNIDFRILLSRFHLHQGRPDRALTLLLPEREHHNRHAGLLAALGESFLAMKNWSSARAEFAALVEVVPDRAQGYYWLALVCGRTNDHQCVKQQLARALKVEPDHFQSRVDWGHVLVHEGRFAEAEQLLEAIRKEAEDNLRVLVLEGKLAQAQNQHERAAQLYTMILDRSPSTALVVELANVKWLANDHQGALALLDNWSHEHPDDIHLLLTRANFAMMQDQPTQAMKYYRRILELEPGQVLALNDLANIMIERDPAEAESLARRALEEVPDHPYVQDTLVLAMLAQGKKGEARTYIDNLLTRTHHGPDARYLDALWKGRSGVTSLARRDLVNLLAEHKDFVLETQARELLRDLDR